MANPLDALNRLYENVVRPGTSEGESATNPVPRVSAADSRLATVANSKDNPAEMTRQLPAQNTLAAQERAQQITDLAMDAGIAQPMPLTPEEPEKKAAPKAKEPEAPAQPRIPSPFEGLSDSDIASVVNTDSAGAARVSGVVEGPNGRKVVSVNTTPGTMQLLMQNPRYRSEDVQFSVIASPEEFANLRTILPTDTPEINQFKQYLLPYQITRAPTAQEQDAEQAAQRKAQEVYAEQELVRAGYNGLKAREIIRSGNEEELEQLARLVKNAQDADGRIANYVRFLEELRLGTGDIEIGDKKFKRTIENVTKFKAEIEKAMKEDQSLSAMKDQLLAKYNSIQEAMTGVDPADRTLIGSLDEQWKDVGKDATKPLHDFTRIARRIALEGDLPPSQSQVFKSTYSLAPWIQDMHYTRSSTLRQANYRNLMATLKEQGATGEFESADGQFKIVIGNDAKLTDEQKAVALSIIMQKDEQRPEVMQFNSFLVNGGEVPKELSAQERAEIEDKRKAVMEAINNFSTTLTPSSTEPKYKNLRGEEITAKTAIKEISEKAFGREIDDATALRYVTELASERGQMIVTLADQWHKGTAKEVVNWLNENGVSRGKQAAWLLRLAEAGKISNWKSHAGMSYMDLEKEIMTLAAGENE